MGKLYISEMPEGYVGCVWKSHKLKTHPPLNGTFKFRTRDCSADGFRPAYGYKRKFHITTDNALVISSSPQDPRYPVQSIYSHPIFKLHDLRSVTRTTDSLQMYMNRFLAPNAPENCVINDNGFGRWQTGYQRTILKDMGYTLVSEKEYRDTRLKGWGEKIIIDDAEYFPMEIAEISLPHSNYCGNRRDRFSPPNVFRRSGHILYEYDFNLIERGNFVDLGSVEFLE